MQGLTFENVKIAFAVWGIIWATSVAGLVYLFLTGS